MGTKLNPGKFDCYEHALPDEPMFVLLARDPDFGRLVEEWAANRHHAVMCGDRPATDMALVEEALVCATEGKTWRRENNGRWRSGVKTA